MSGHNRAHDFIEELEELPQELAGAAEAVVQDIEDTRLGRWAVGAYVWLMSRAPSSTKGRILAASVLFAFVLAPSLAMLYVSLSTGQEQAQSWFGDYGYAGVFLANLVGTGTLFIPVPALTAAAQALIVSGSSTLSPFWLGVAGGMGMAIGEVTAYVAGMAAAVIAREEQLKAPGRLQPIVDKVTRSVTWLMRRYGAPTLFTLSALPNPIFELAGWSAGATRYPFLKYMAAVSAGCVIRGLMLAYIGDKLIFS